MQTEINKMNSAKRTQKTAFTTAKTPMRREKRTQPNPTEPERTHRGSGKDQRRMAKGKLGMAEGPRCRRVRYSEFAIRNSAFGFPRNADDCATVVLTCGQRFAAGDVGEVVQEGFDA